MKVAIVHYWFLGMRGGEKVIEQLCELFPNADVYAHVIDESQISNKIKMHKLAETFIGGLPFAKKKYKLYLPLMPYALEQLNLQKYDLVVSSESGPSKGIICSPDAMHICYCHSPMRYIWDQHYIYKSEFGWVKKKAFSIFSHYLRLWDISSASRVDRFVANSTFVAKRIERYYRRDSIVINPPVNLDKFKSSGKSGDYYLMAGELVEYKRTDIAISAFSMLDRDLVIAGSGPQYRKLKKLASKNIRLVGRVSDQKLSELYSGCKALIFPGKEDFGIVPLECMASGKPVIAFNGGGVVDSVIDGKTGILFGEQTASKLVETIQYFENNGIEYSCEEIEAHARKYSEESFRKKFKSVVDDLMSRRSNKNLKI